MPDPTSTPTPHPSPTPSRIVSERVVLEGRKFNFAELQVRDPDGQTRPKMVVRHPGAVVVVPILDRGGIPHVVMIRNDRYAVAARGPAILDELPAGTIETDTGRPDGRPDDPAETARRECIEETGYDPRALTPLGWFYTTPGMTDEMMHAFAATDLEHVGQRLEADESIAVVLRPAAEALAMLDRGELHDAKTMLALLLAHRRGLLG